MSKMSGSLVSAFRRYVAPETQKVRLAGNAEHPTGGYTPAVDVWAAGVMLYLLFTAQVHCRAERSGCFGACLKF